MLPTLEDYKSGQHLLLDAERANELTNQDINIAFVDMINALEFLIKDNEIEFNDGHIKYVLGLKKIK